ncbi:MAG: hypothetical protein AAB574_02725 [Patescibacteria group bacterium]
MSEKLLFQAPTPTGELKPLKGEFAQQHFKANRVDLNQALGKIDN